MAIMLFTPFDQLVFLGPVNLESHLNEFTSKMQNKDGRLHGVSGILVLSPES